VLLVGLGNPGSTYERNRHNVGFRIIDALAEANSCSSFKTMLSLVSVSSFSVDKGKAKDKVIIAKPLTFMNLSGQAVRFLADFYKIPNQKVYVFHDDIDLEFGRVKIKNGGGSGGHNGIKSIDDLRGNDYWRIRIGVGRPLHKSMVSSYVLNDFSSEEESILQDILSAITKNISLLFENSKLFETKINEVFQNDRVHQ
jgi:PTH1 family peptidyl-tRNA hydrolase